MVEKKAAVLILGAGAWGTALGSRLATNKSLSVQLWSRSEVDANAIRQLGVNEKYLPKILLSPDLQISSNLSESMNWLNEQPQNILRLVVLAVPAKGFYQI